MTEDLDRPEFLRGAVRPVECLRAGWDVIKGNYGQMLGITFVGVLLGGLAPLGVMVGPMTCGIYICLFRRARGRPVRFEMLFDGFKHFLPSLVATLIRMAPIWVVSIPGSVVIMVLYINLLTRQPGQPITADAAWTILAAYGIYLAALAAVWLVVAVLSFFTYPLIVDRKLSGLDALKTSVRAVRANLGGVVGLVLLTFLLEVAGVLACYVGLVLVLPVHFAAAAVAYRQVFPAPEPPPLPAPKADDGQPDLEAGPAERAESEPSGGPSSGPGT